MKAFLCAALAAALVIAAPVSGLARQKETRLHISEIMACNLLIPVQGRVSGWVELHNAGSRDLDLSGYGLSDRPSLPWRARLSGVLPAGERLTLVCDREGLGFTLAREGSLLLTGPDGQPADQVSYPELACGASLMREGDAWKETFSPTPGAPNRYQSLGDAETERFSEASLRGIVISEVMAASAEYDFQKPYTDWVELYNPGKTPLPLKGLYLSADGSILRQWAFPETAVLRPGGRLIVYCSGQPIPIRGKDILVNETFTIDKSDGVLILSDGEQVIDCVFLGRQYPGIAYGRPEGQGAFRYFPQATPLKPNPQAGFTERTGPVAFSRPGGFADGPFHLALSSQAGARIHYTLDGSRPTERSAEYTAPLLIGENTVVRALARRDGLLDAPVVTHSYLFETPLPCLTVCLSGDRSIFFGPSGIFEKSNHGNLKEQRVNIEMMNASGTPVNQEAALRLTGGTSRTSLPRTFSVYARSGISEGSFAVNPFPDRPYAAYKAFTFRAGGTDAARAYIRDPFLCSLAQGYRLMYQASAPAAVYVNGEFFGAFDLRERTNKDAFAQWEGITDRVQIRNVTIIKNKGAQIRGSRQDLADLSTFCLTNDLNVPENLKYFLDRFDLDSLLAHSAFEIIAGNRDMQNVRYYRFPGGKWKMVLFDLDLAMLDGARSPLEYYADASTRMASYFYNGIFQALMQVPAMRERFLELTGQILAHRFVPETVCARLDVWQEAWTPLMLRHSQRWRHFSFDAWTRSMASLRQQLATRPLAVTGHLKKAFAMTDGEVERYFGAFLGAFPDPRQNNP